VFTFASPGRIHPEEGVLYSPGVSGRMGFSIGLRYSSEARVQIGSMDLIHIHHPFISGQLMLRAVGVKKPLIFTAHSRYDHLTREYMPKMFVPAGLSFLRWYMPRFCRRMARVVCNSPASIEGMKNCGVVGNFTVVPNGIPLAPFMRARRSDGVRKKMGEWPVQLLYTGRLAVEKGLPFLLQAFAQLAKSNPEAGLALVGGGPMEDMLRRLCVELGISDRVCFWGSVAYEDLPPILASADVYVMPSVMDTHPLTVIEAMASGLPCLVVRSAAYEGMVENEVNGWVSNHTVEGFARGMEILANDGSLRNRLGERARITAERYAIENTASRMVEIYSEVLADWTWSHNP